MAGGPPAPVRPGDVLQVSISFQAAEGNVVGAGIRFAEDGPIRTIQIPDASGLSEGTLDFDVEIPADICDDLSRICHDIKCYEFAVTSEGKVSRANIVDIGLVCGGCDESSCRSLLMCEDQPVDPTPDAGGPSGPVFESGGSITFNGMTYTPSNSGTTDPISCFDGDWYRVKFYTDGYSYFTLEGPPEVGSPRSVVTEAAQGEADDCHGMSTTVVAYRECEDDGSVGGTCTRSWKSVSGTVSVALVEGTLQGAEGRSDQSGPFYEYTVDVQMSARRPVGEAGEDTAVLSGSFLVEDNSVDRHRP
jgi:hypothetical protein